MILAIVIGIAFHNLVGTPGWAKPGVTFSMRRLLRIAIILLGLQLTATQVIEVGGRGLAVIAATLIATFVFTGTPRRGKGSVAERSNRIADHDGSEEKPIAEDSHIKRAAVFVVAVVSVANMIAVAATSGVVLA